MEKSVAVADVAVTNREKLTTNAPLTKQIGDWGERRAEEHLKAEGFTILHRNWRHGRYELDIVVKKGEIVHFIEVKCRKAEGLTTPEEAITEKKSSAVIKAAEAYIVEHDIHNEIQFDLVSVEYSDDGGFRVEHITNAITPRW